ncbi:MAG: pseudouridylate synthase [Saprospiraceae bacterium]|nr:pseudouridylate synthase [Saprospiraceae bacterium]
MLEIIYQDQYLVAINKPHGMFVHKTYLDPYATEFVVQILRDQIGQWVYPIHRLDRKTSGLLLLALDKETLAMMNHQFEDRQVSKNYLAIVRGFLPESGVVDYPLFNDTGKEQDAVTNFETLQTVEIDLPHGKHATSRYSLVKANPITGRTHQIRRHFSHIFHPIIGDRPHGCNKQNKLFLEKYALNTMMLHAHQLTFTHPFSQEPTSLIATPSAEFKRISDVLGFSV